MHAFFCCVAGVGFFEQNLHPHTLGVFELGTLGVAKIATLEKQLIATSVHSNVKMAFAVVVDCLKRQVDVCRHMNLFPSSVKMMLAAVLDQVASRPLIHTAATPRW